MVLLTESKTVCGRSSANLYCSTNTRLEGCGECVRYRCPYLNSDGFCSMHCRKARLVYDCPELERAKSRAASRWKSVLGGVSFAYP